MDIRQQLPASPAASGMARKTLDGWLTNLVGDDTANAARLVVSELVENAVRHAGLRPTDTINLLGLATEDIVRVEVEQPTPATDAHVVDLTERELAAGGMGLRIVQELASAWGVTPGTPGAVWFEVDRDVREATPPDGL